MDDAIPQAGDTVLMGCLEADLSFLDQAERRPRRAPRSSAGIGVPVILKRTFTLYADVNRVIRPLGIEDRSTIAPLKV